MNNKHLSWYKEINNTLLLPLGHISNNNQLEPLPWGKHDQHQNSMGFNHVHMWILVLNHMVMWTRLVTPVQVGDWRKYALEAIIKLFIFPYIMINVYYSC